MSWTAFIEELRPGIREMNDQKLSYRLVALSVIGALALMAGTGHSAAQDEKMPTKEAVIETMVAEGADPEQAACLLDALGEDWRRMMGLEGTRVEADRKTFEDAMASCGIEPDNE